jgi:hypothetical protein
MVNKGDALSKVTIGNISGGIANSIIAGHDIRYATINVAGQTVPADKDPTHKDLQQLLADIQEELAAVRAQQEALKTISSATPFVVHGVAESIKDAAITISAPAPPRPNEVTSVQARLSEATSLLSGVLDGAKTMAEKMLGAGTAMQSLTEKLAPLVDKMAVAALWAAKLFGLA